jgi:CubicO group peptidase (beta-lactamase class C family)
MSRTLLAVLVALHVPFLPAPAYADAVDQYVEAEMARQHIAGLSLAVVRNGKVVRAKGYGFYYIFWLADDGRVADYTSYSL